LADADDAVGVGALDGEVPWVGGILVVTRIASERRTVELRRLDLTKCFVGPLVVVFVFE
jgi:hypothetical protein